MNESEEDRLIGQWHDLARDVESGVALDLPTARKILSDVLSAFAPGLQCPGDEAALLPFISATRQLEVSWNRYLCEALIEAGAARSDDLAASLSILDQFAAQCPWMPFAQIARDQRENYTAGA
jgi:hypothetical protein